MKLYLKTTVVVLGLGLLCFLGYQVYAKMQYKQEVEAALKTMPDFSFETLKGETFTQNNLDTDRPTVLIYFNSGCDYCQHEAQSIEQHIESFKEVQLVFVSYETKEAIYLDEIKGLSKNQLTVLNENNIKTSEDFLDAEEELLLSLKGFGIKTIEKIKDKLIN